nr:immunoglobulin light chain junction region [Macaca mulatta]
DYYCCSYTTSNIWLF